MPGPTLLSRDLRERHACSGERVPFNIRPSFEDDRG